MHYKMKADGRYVGKAVYTLSELTLEGKSHCLGFTLRSDLKPVYRASNKENAEATPDQLAAKWGDTYPIVIKSWRNK